MQPSKHPMRFTFFLLLGMFITNCTLKKQVKKSSIKTLSIYENSVYTTAHKSEYKLSKTSAVNFDTLVQPKETDVHITVNANKTYQTFLGIGGALTDAAAETFAKLNKEQQDRFLEAYYDTEKGIGYSLGRTSIHSCDFSSKSFTYIEEGDKKLATFSIQKDREFRIPFIKKAIQAAGGKLTFYVSPWSPPAFMKTNNNMLLGGKLRKEYRQTWANYYAKFIKAYETEGIPIWGLTIQNEPMAVQRWESCIYTAAEERDFLKDYLGPTLEKEGLGEKNIVVWDHNRDLLYQRSNTIFSDPEASKYAWGSGFHWYEDWKDGQPMYDRVEAIQKAFPEKKLLFTEGCNESYDLKRITDEDPKLAERYGKSMIHDFNRGTVGWTDWNILLDHKGGPNHVGNLCFAPVHGNTFTGVVTYTNTYYYIGHFSKFIRPNAKRIAAITSSNQLLATAFKNNDDSIVIVALNQSNQPLNYSIEFNESTGHTTIPAHGIQTIILTKKTRNKHV